ncbi:MAG: hypothetical protein H6707_08625 [Deltaproteobacteria bacterium]|nr:hypothetical protein [Deltaproteobacteria bacterium]
MLNAARCFFIVQLLGASGQVQASADTALIVIDDGGGARVANSNVRIGTAVRLFAAVRRQHNGRTLIFSDVKRFRLGTRTLRADRPLRALGRIEAIRWFRVEPHPHHQNLPAPNEGNPAYSNSVLFGKNHGRWLGYDTLEYFETPIAGGNDTPMLLVRDAHPSYAQLDRYGGLGTMRYKVAIKLGDRWVSSPGIESLTRSGISARVTRISFRERGEGYVDYLRGLFNVPNVFGSAGVGARHQTELYQGADCADVIIGAIRAAGVKLPYTSAAGLQRFARPVTTRLLMTKSQLLSVNRDQVVRLSFSTDVRPGDIMLIDYAGFNASPRAWDHVAVIDHDRGVSGVFDPQDPILHVGYLYGLTEEPAASQAPAYVRFLRLNPRIRQQLLRAARRRGVH